MIDPRYIKLQNDVYQLIPGFIFANSIWNPRGRAVAGAFGLEQETDPPIDLPMVQPGTGRGDLVICGAGPRLEAGLAEIDLDGKDLWACNAGLPFLVSRGYRVTHGVAIDQSRRMFEQVWADPPSVEYLLATSVHPELIGHIVKAGRPLTLFHSFIGFDHEYDTYANLYPECVVSGNGLNVVNRSIAIAQYLGYERIWLAGADCALGVGGTWHAGGDKTPIGRSVLKASVDGRTWYTHVDLCYSAIELVRERRRLAEGGVPLTFLGDTLPAAIQDWPDDQLDRLVRWSTRAEAEALGLTVKTRTPHIES